MGYIGFEEVLFEKYDAASEVSVAVAYSVIIE